MNEFQGIAYDSSEALEKYLNRLDRLVTYYKREYSRGVVEDGYFTNTVGKSIPATLLLHSTDSTLN